MKYKLDELAFFFLITAAGILLIAIAILAIVAAFSIMNGTVVGQ